jgi:hypothetical protein
MAFLDILNIPGLLGTELHTFKRANVYDKLDLGLAGVVALLAGVVLLLNGFATPLACVPAACNGDSGNANPNCALDYRYQSGVCRAEVLSAPDSGFHYLLVVLALSLIGLLTVPIYWGSTASRELFDNFYYIWAKLKNGDEECKDTEWKRRMHFVLDQLKNSKSLSTRYALYHGLALLLDLVALTVVVLFTVNFTEYGLENNLPSLDMDGGAHNGTTWSSLFKSSTPVAGGLANSAKAKCSGGQFVCDIPNRNLFKWFGVLTSLVLTAKALINAKCLLFSLGLPGLFGRNFLIYADQLNDNTGEPIYHIQTNPCLVLLQTSLVVLRLVFVAPFLWLLAFCRFYSRKHDSPKETIKRQSATNIRAEQKESKKVEKVAKAPETEANGDAKAVKNGDSKKEKKEEPKKEEPKKEEANKKEKEEKPKEKEVPKAKEVPKVEEKEEVISTPLVARPAQNWSDLFFIIDSLSYNIDACDLILFMTKINPIPGLENKKVNVDVSYLDTTSNTLVISHTDSGIIENLLDTELSTEGGLQIVGWLEGPTGIMWSQRTCDNPKNLGFAVSLGSTYELVSAVYGRGRMLARLSNFTFQCPQDTKKQMKKYGANVPLSAFISQSLFQKFSTDNGTTKE